MYPFPESQCGDLPSSGHFCLGTAPFAWSRFEQVPRSIPLLSPQQGKAGHRPRQPSYGVAVSGLKGEDGAE
jgi:hypothetical protein